MKRNIFENCELCKILKMQEKTTKISNFEPAMDFEKMLKKGNKNV